MKASTLRVRFLLAVERFNAGGVDILAFWEEVEILNRAGFRRELREGDEGRAVGHLTWSLDMYDSRRPPRSGLIGQVRDMFDAAFRSEYRISAEEVKTRAIAVERIMKQADDA